MNDRISKLFALWMWAEREHLTHKSDPSKNLGTGTRAYQAEKALREAVRSEETP